MFEALLSPDKARLLQENTPQRALASLALRALWHAMFDSAPAVLALAPPNGKPLMEGFLRWADDLHLSMNWAMHSHLLEWLAQQYDWRNRLEARHVKELMAATTARWARENLDFPMERAILLYCPLMLGYAISTRRSDQPGGQARTSLVTLSPQPQVQACVYTLSCQGTIWRDLKWLPLPR